MRAHIFIASALLLAGMPAAHAHRAPNSLVSLDFSAHVVRAEMRVPVSELAYATAAERGDEDFAVYLARHVAAETPAGARWALAVRGVRRINDGEHEYLVALVELTPPRGASARELVFIDDAVTHEVRNHVVTVLARSDLAAHSAAAGPQLLGFLQYPARRLVIERPR